MRILIQRVTHATVSIAGAVRGEIGCGMVVLVGVEDSDTAEDVEWLALKLTKMRIFADKVGVMNLSVCDVQGDIMVVSQFTLHASTRKGNRPSYIYAARPEVAIPLYEQFVSEVEMQLGRKIATGEFGADMQIALVNDGPVTIWVDSKNRE